MAGYTRQSTADIQTGEDILAAPLNAEFNAIRDAFNGSTGHEHDGTTGNGPKIDLISSVSGVLPVANGGIAAIHKLNATTAPAVGDDSGDGYGVGSVWIDTTNDKFYICVDASLGAAVWKIFQPYSAILDEYAAVDPTAAGLALLDDADASAQRTTLGLVIGTNVQAYDAGLQSISGLTTSSDKTIYTTGSDTYATTDLTSFGRSLIDDADASAARTTLGVVIGTNVQAYSSNLDEYAAVNPTTAGLALLDDADASAQRTTLGVAIGTDVQAYSANLALWSAESPTGYLTTASAVRHDVVQTLPDGAKAQARLNIGIANKGFFHKPSRLAPCILRTGAGTLSLAAGTILEVEGNLFTYATDTAITMPTLAAGDDVAIWVRPDGQPVATLDHVSPPVTNSRKIGGAHYAPGGNATAYNTGGNTTPGFNAYSMWDEKFRPACADPRGMSLIAGKFWCDIYLLGVNHHTDGTSKYNVAIADGSSPPKIPTMFGGNGSTAYGSLTWWEAAEVLMSHGKDLLSYADFAAAMYGSTENSASGTDPVSTILRQAYTSIYGIMLATGNLWVWGSDFGGPFASAAWSNTNGGRGQVFNQSNAALFGGNWYNAESGSRASSWSDLPSNSNNTISARGRSDHLILA